MNEAIPRIYGVYDRNSLIADIENIHRIYQSTAYTTVYEEGGNHMKEEKKRVTVTLEPGLVRMLEATGEQGQRTIPQQIRYLIKRGTEKRREELQHLCSDSEGRIYSLKEYQAYCRGYDEPGVISFPGKHHTQLHNGAH